MDEPGVEIRKSRRAKVLSLKAELNLQVEAKKKEAATSEARQEQDHGGCGLPIAGREYQHLYSLLPGRHVQIDTLLMLLIGGAPPPCLYVCGTSGSGKSVTLNLVLSRLKLLHVVVNCRECYAPHILFRDTLNNLSGTFPEESNRYVGFSQCDNLPRFIHLFSKLMSSRQTEPYFIVLDHAECLKNHLGSLLLTALMRLSELSGCKVCVILVSDLVPGRVLNEAIAKLYLSITFPQYTKAETLEIMLLDCPSNQMPGFYQTFIHHIWNVFQNVCRDLPELRHLSSILFPKYVEPVESGEIGCHETRKLWKHIEPFFRSIMSQVYLRQVSTPWEERITSTPSTSSTSSTSSKVFELPVYSKYILISSFLASYNPAKTDRHFFSKLKQIKARKSKKAKTEEESELHLGPKSFSLDRMMAIFYSIISEPVFPIADLHFQVSSLVSLQLIAQISKQELLDMPKYKCLMSLDQVQHVAKSIGFDLVHYLHDFNL